MPTKPTNQLECRGLDQSRARVELRAEGEEKHAVGYAAIFYREGDKGTEYPLFENYVERIMPGAFDAIGDDDVRCLFNHDSNLLLGRNVSGTLSLKVDEIGLFYDCPLPDTSLGRDLGVNLERGDVSGSSFGFYVTEQVRRDVTIDGADYVIREILKVSVFDVGPVTFPAYEATSAELARRSLDEWSQEREREARKLADSRRRQAARLRLGC